MLPVEVNRLGVRALPFSGQPASNLIRATPTPIIVPPIPSPTAGPIPSPTAAPSSNLSASILQPSETTSTIIQNSLQQSDYIAPGETSLISPTVAMATSPQPIQQTLIFGLDSNTFWLLLLIAAAILIAVLS